METKQIICKICCKAIEPYIPRKLYHTECKKEMLRGKRRQWYKEQIADPQKKKKLNRSRKVYERKYCKRPGIKLKLKEYNHKYYIEHRKEKE